MSSIHIEEAVLRVSTVTCLFFSYYSYDMADPKYANLPGIDLDSKDVYECGDLPEDDQNYNTEELNSSSVELVDTKSSFEKFSGKYISGGGKDLSGQFYGKKTTGYTAGDCGLVAPGEEETIFQKFNRLKIEVGDLLEDVDKVQAAKTNDTNVFEMVEQLKALQMQLDSVSLESITQLTNKEDQNFNKLAAALQSQANKKFKSPTSDDSGVYQVFFNPGQQENESLQASQLEQRLARLEKVIGSDSPKFNVLRAHCKDGSLQEAVAAIEAKLALLDPELLPQVDSRLQSILSKVNEINKVHKMSAEERTELNTKISELYEITQKWEGVFGTLPVLVDRLKQLDTLHAKATDFASTLSHLESVQMKIAAQLNGNDATQKKISEMMQENVAVIESNISELNKRISSLTK